MKLAARAVAALAATLTLLAPAIWNRLPAASVRHRRLPGALVRGLPRAEPLDRLRPVRRGRLAARFLAGGRAAGGRHRLGAGARAALLRVRRAAVDLVRRRRRPVGDDHVAVDRRHPADRHLRRPRGARAPPGGDAARDALPQRSVSRSCVHRLFGCDPQRDVPGPGRSRGRRAGGVVHRSADRRPGRGRCGPWPRSRCPPSCCSPPISRCPDASPGRRAATASCSRACCRTASSSAISMRIAASGSFKLCPYRDELPKTADAFLWGAGPFNKLGRFDGLGDEMRTIVLESLAEYPGMQIETAIAASARQLVSVVDRRRRADHDPAHLRHHGAIHAVGGAGDARGAPAARRAAFRGAQRRAGAARARRHGGAAAVRLARPAAAGVSSTSPFSPRPCRSRSSAMRSCAARCPTRTTATARGSPGCRCSSRS